MSTCSDAQRLRVSGLVAEHGARYFRAILTRFDLHRLDASFRENLECHVSGRPFPVREKCLRPRAAQCGEAPRAALPRCQKSGKWRQTPRPRRRSPRLRWFSVSAGTFRMSRLPTITWPSNSTPGKRARLGAGGEHDMLRLDLRGMAVGFDGHPARARPASPAAHRLDFVLAEQEFDTLGMLVHDLVLARQDCSPVELLRSGTSMPNSLGILEGVVDFGVMQQDLGRDTTHMQAGPAEKPIFFDNQSLQSPLRRADGGYISARPTTDNRQIILGQGLPPWLAKQQPPHGNGRRNAKQEPLLPIIAGNDKRQAGEKRGSDSINRHHVRQPAADAASVTRNLILGCVVAATGLEVTARPSWKSLCDLYASQLAPRRSVRSSPHQGFRFGAPFLAHRCWLIAANVMWPSSSIRSGRLACIRRFGYYGLASGFAELIARTRAVRISASDVEPLTS